jgi:uncharacterized protein involved in tolerance to divalent cations
VAIHPYDLPEILVVKIEGGDKKYLNWLSEGVS